MPTIRPHALFRVWSPDAAAECLNGISPELYAHIWNNIVPLYDGQERSEVPDDFDKRCTSKYWKHFSDAQKAELNAAAKAHEKELDSYR